MKGGGFCTTLFDHCWVLIWNRPKGERCLHLSVWSHSGERDLWVICIKQGSAWVHQWNYSEVRQSKEEGKLHCFQKNAQHLHWYKASTDCTWGQPRGYRHWGKIWSQAFRKNWDVEALGGARGSCHQRSQSGDTANSDAAQKSLGTQWKKHIGLGVGSLFCFCFKMGKAKVSLPCERKEPAGTER